MNCKHLYHLISVKCDIFKYCQRIHFLNVSMFSGSIKAPRCMSKNQIPQMGARENLSPKKLQKFQSNVYY